VRILVAITFILWVVTGLLFIQRSTPYDLLCFSGAIAEFLILGLALTAIIAVHVFINEKRDARERNELRQRATHSS
jgi:hypothetical protein